MGFIESSREHSWQFASERLTRVFTVCQWRFAEGFLKREPQVFFAAKAGAVDDVFDGKACLLKQGDGARHAAELDFVQHAVSGCGLEPAVERAPRNAGFFRHGRHIHNIMAEVPDEFHRAPKANS